MRKPVVPKTKLGRFLRREMVARDWTYQYFAMVMNTSTSQVHDWVNGKHEPTIANLQHLAKVLRIEMVDLIGAA